MLTECGFVRVTTGDGSEFTFRPSFGRIADLGDPQEIVSLFAALHGPKAAEIAACVLACLCDQEDPTPMIGWKELGEQYPGLMPAYQQIIIARHLMTHAIVGNAKPDAKGEGKFSDRFDASEYIAAAQVHLGLSADDASALSMTGFQRMFAMKFPNAEKADGGRDIPSRDEYDAAMAKFEERRRGDESR